MHKIATAVLISFIVHMIVAQDSTAGIYEESAGGYQYKLFYNQKANWAAAFEICKAENKELVSIDSLSELYFLHGFVNRSGLPQTEDIWTSGSDAQAEGNHIWMSNGKKVANSLWSINQPDNASTKGEHCHELWWSPPKSGGIIANYYMNDRGCLFQTNFICKVALQCLPFTA